LRFATKAIVRSAARLTMPMATKRSSGIGPICAAADDRIRPKARAHRRPAAHLLGHRSSSGVGPNAERESDRCRTNPAALAADVRPTADRSLSCVRTVCGPAEQTPVRCHGPAVIRPTFHRERDEQAEQHEALDEDDVGMRGVAVIAIVLIADGVGAGALFIIPCILMTGGMMWMMMGGTGSGPRQR
jgi:hypothetical protein